MWTYDGKLKMARYEGHWQVRWSSTDLHPRLGEHQTLRCGPTRRSVPRSTRSAAPTCWRPATCTTTRWTLESRRLPDQYRPLGGRRTASLRRHDQRPAAPGRAGQRHRQARRPDHAAHRRQQPHRPGHRQPARRGDHAAGRAAADRLPLRARPDQPGQEVGDRRSSTARRAGEWSASTRTTSTLAVLHEVQPAPAPSVSISLDRAVQNAAQRAVDNQGRQAMIVVIKPSTGEILAVAQNSAADAVGSACHHRPVPAGVDVQDGHRGRGARARHGKSQHAFGLPRPPRHRAAGGPQLRRIRSGRGADVARVRQFVQHHLRRVGQPDAAARTDAGRQPVRHRDWTTRSTASARSPDRCRRRSTSPSAPRTGSARARCWSLRSAWRWSRRRSRPERRRCPS